MHSRGEDIVEGDDIYFKKGKEKIWRGPVRVISTNGKKLFIDQGSHQSTVNRDSAIRVGEEFWNIDDVQNKTVVEENMVESNDRCFEDEITSGHPVVNNAAAVDDINKINDIELDDNLDNNEVAALPEVFNYEHIKKGQSLKFVPKDSDEVISGKVLSRAGKAGGPLKYWWNIENMDNGVKNSFDTSKFKSIEHLEAENTDGEVEKVFVVQVPRYLHSERRCVEAKERELASWEEFHVYDEVQDEGQVALGTSRMLVEKVIDRKLDVKARLCVRGDQEQGEFRTDSPTVHKSSINIFFMLAAKNRWEIQTSDIKCAFLQGEIIDREVYVKPPKERRVKGILWLMRKRAYGLTDASRGFYLELCSTLLELGCKQSKYDPAMYLYFNEDASLEGMVLTHVDDLLHGSGTDQFNTKVMNPLKEKFTFGSEEKCEFRYVGMQVKQTNEFISVNQDHYVLSMELPLWPEGDGDDLLDDDGQTDFRSLLGRLGWLGNHSRPDLVFDHIALSTRIGKATVDDMCSALKIARKMLASTTEIKFPALGPFANWVMEVYADAGFRVYQMVFQVVVGK